MSKTGSRTILLLTFRTYFIRLFYNYNNLFGEGLCYCLSPLLTKSPASSIAKEDVIKKHMKFFNTSEYMSGFALGIILKNKDAGEDKMESIKNVLSSVLGSIGDRLIYKLIVPVIVLSSLNIFVFARFRPDLFTVIFILSIIAIFNIFGFFIRYYGISSGLENGMESLKVFQTPVYKRLTSILKTFRNILAVILIINLIIVVFF